MIESRAGPYSTQGDKGMKAIVVTDQAAGTAGMKLAERPERQPAITAVAVRVKAPGYVTTNRHGPSTCTNALDLTQMARTTPETNHQVVLSIASFVLKKKKE